MLPPTKAELCLEKVLRAEAELQAYARNDACKPEKQKQLVEAVKFAVDEFVDQVAASPPTEEVDRPQSIGVGLTVAMR